MFDLLMKTEPNDEEKSEIIHSTLDAYEKHLNPGFLRFKKSADSKVVEWSGSGAIMVDIHGKSFIDCLGGYGVFCLGHRPKEVIDAVIETYRRIGLSSQELLSPYQSALAFEIAQLSPGDLSYSYFHSGGAESNDAAIKIARLATGRNKHITFSMSFHGKTMGALSATNRERIRKPFEPLVPGFIEVPFGDLSAVEKVMNEEIASVIVEPIQGEGGINVPPDDFLPGLRKLCDKFGALLHLDEVQTGFGRTGKWFACEHYKVVPDIMTLGKALGGGVMPISAVHGNARSWERLAENPWYVTCTFGGNPPACSAGIATIKALKARRVVEQVPEKGKLFKSLLIELQEDFKNLIREVRGVGLLLGVEFFTEELGTRVAKDLFEAGVLTAHTMNNPKVIRIEPPLIISEEEIHEAVVRFRKVLESL